MDTMRVLPAFGAPAEDDDAADRLRAVASLITSTRRPAGTAEHLFYSRLAGLFTECAANIDALPARCRASLPTAQAMIVDLADGYLLMAPGA